MASPTATQAPSPDVKQPGPAALHHVSIPVKDMVQAQRFFINVLGAELYLDTPGFSEVKCGGMIIGLSPQSGGWTAPDAEFPHYAFRVEAEDLWGLKARMEEHGVVTHPIWTRNGYTGLMYFRDPSGNLFELYCPRVKDEDQAKLARRGENGFEPPIASLGYDWKG